MNNTNIEIHGCYRYTGGKDDPSNPHTGQAVEVLAYDPADDLYDCASPYGDLYARADELEVIVHEPGQRVRFTRQMLREQQLADGEHTVIARFEPGSVGDWDDEGVYNSQPLYTVDAEDNEDWFYESWYLVPVEPVNEPEAELVPEFVLGQQVRVNDSASGWHGRVGHVIDHARAGQAPGIEASLKYAVSLGEGVADWDYFRASQLVAVTVGDVVAAARSELVVPPRTHLELFLEFAKAAGLYVREADGQGYHRWLIVSQAPYHFQLVNLRFIAENGNLDYMSIDYDDPGRRTVSYTEAYPNILAQA